MYKRKYKHGDTPSQLTVVIRRPNYHPLDDILEIDLSDKPVAGEVSPDWNVNVSAA
jgi:hypothetical protein